MAMFHGMLAVRCCPGFPLRFAWAPSSGPIVLLLVLLLVLVLEAEDEALEALPLGIRY